MSYTIKDIFDYSIGNRVYNAKELENNPMFMAEVVCRNKELLSHCSDDIMRNPVFVKKVIDKYSDDLDFIGPLADNCMKYKPKSVFVDHIDYVFIQARMAMIEEYNEDISFDFDYSEAAERFYNTGQEFIDKFFRTEDGSNYTYYFLNYLTLYKSDKPLIDYIANRYIKDMAINEGFESKVHRNFSSYEEFDKKGKLSFLANFINNYDDRLARYIIDENRELQEMNRQFEHIKNNWDIFKEDSTKENGIRKSNILLFVPKEK